MLPSYEYYVPELAWTTIHSVPPPATKMPKPSPSASAPSADEDDDEDDGGHADHDENAHKAAPPPPPRRNARPPRPTIVAPRTKPPACPGFVEPASVAPAFG